LAALLLLMALASIAITPAADAEDYPSRPVDLIVPFAAGGGGANGHITTFLGKRFRDRKPNALASARDQRIFVLETEIQLSPRCSYLLISACESTSPGKARPNPQTEATWLGPVSRLPKS
jgi:hypothetical protein